MEWERKPFGGGGGFSPSCAHINLLKGPGCRGFECVAHSPCTCVLTTFQSGDVSGEPDQSLLLKQGCKASWFPKPLQQGLKEEALT